MKTTHKQNFLTAALAGAVASPHPLSKPMPRNPTSFSSSLIMSAMVI